MDVLIFGIFTTMGLAIGMFGVNIWDRKAIKRIKFERDYWRDRANDLLEEKRKFFDNWEKIAKINPYEEEEI